MPAVHDRGGWPTDEPIDREEHEWADWERQTQSLRTVLDSRGIMNVDELRRGIESIEPAEYEASTYFERWSASIETNLVEKGVLTTEEIDERAKGLRDQWGYPE
ncbi:MAG: nitrile hydratase subunit beta [Chloroflexi bacterium]|jgi:nitrile hydratase subunit beta|nr:nitrile hydratase subunit beta [Chloroflexota bacterium]MBT4073378.1 nitrile hydratase subunit beta [Chloroflexota bacterium]MBT4516221.1 nitrile hydratase subunit beta [Chloroflexota bacterium]MBT6681057.1 nitrile hydratase subunit beta [Chloroflexota bacterium]